MLSNTLTVTTDVSTAIGIPDAWIVPDEEITVILAWMPISLDEALDPEHGDRPSQRKSA